MVNLKELKHFRIDKDLTILQLSKQSGVDRQVISRMENGKYAGSLSAVDRIADALGLDITFTPKNK
jgi:transcriptional regulator with XRE-family HTH domain